MSTLLENRKNEVKASIIQNLAYRTSTRKCWSCKKSTQIYNWLRRRLHERSFTPPEPIPRNIIWAYTKQSDCEYWVNRCEHCRAAQGDVYLYYLEKAFSNELILHKRLGSRLNDGTLYSLEELQRTNKKGRSEKVCEKCNSRYITIPQSLKIHEIGVPHEKIGHMLNFN